MYEGKYGEAAACNGLALGGAVAREVLSRYEAAHGKLHAPLEMARLIQKEVDQALSAWCKEMQLIYGKPPAEKQEAGSCLRAVRSG